MKTILVITEHRRNELRPISLELITAAQDLRQADDDKIIVAVIGNQAESYISELSLQGVDEIVTIKDDSTEFNPDVYEATVSALIASKQPAVVLLPHSIDSLGYAATLVEKSNYGFATDVFQVEYDGDDLVATRAGYNQKVNVEVDFPNKDIVILTVRPGVYKPIEETATPEITSQEPVSIESHSKNIQFVELASDGDVDITQSEFMMSIGRGIADEENVEQFRELSEMLGATLGCSRPIADAGWLPKSRQVGQSGKVVGACKLYLALGISGSIQHMAGMKHVPTIIAVNTDPNASIFTIAKYGFVSDIFDMEEELRNLLD